MKVCKYCRVIFKICDYHFCPYCNEMLEDYEYGDWKKEFEYYYCTCNECNKSRKE